MPTPIWCCPFAVLCQPGSQETIPETHDDKPGLPSWEQSMHTGPAVNNMFCSLCSQMWITIWLGTPVTPTKTGMARLLAAGKQVGVWGQWELSELCAGSVPGICGWIGSREEVVHLCSRSLYLPEKCYVRRSHASSTQLLHHFSEEKSDHGALQEGFGVGQLDVIHDLISLCLSFLTKNDDGESKSAEIHSL